MIHDLKLDHREQLQLIRMGKEAGSDWRKLVTGIVRLYLQGKLKRPKEMTPEEVLEAGKLSDRGYSTAEIGEVLGRTKSAVQRAVIKYRKAKEATT